MYKIKNYIENNDVRIIEQKGPFTIVEFLRDLSVTPSTAQTAYFCNEMNIRKRQIICNVDEDHAIVLQKGEMQWMIGSVKSTTGIKGAGDLLDKAFRGKVTGESAIKPEYVGEGNIVTEPTYKYPVILNLEEWGGSVVLDDGLFLACEGSVRHKTAVRTTLSSAVAGGEGLFNLELRGSGYAVIESLCPKEELIEIELDNDTVKIDGNYAIAWSSGLEFTVERSGKTLLGSAVSGEGLVNVYRGTGKILMMPVR